MTDLRLLAHTLKDALPANADQDLRALIEALEKKGDHKVEALTKKVLQLKAPKAPTSSASSKETSEKLVATQKKLEALVEDSRSWTAPDGDRARAEVRKICKGMTKPELAQLSKQYLGRTNSNRTKDQILDLLAQPVIWGLQHRFANQGA